MAELNVDNNSQDVKYLKNQLNIARNEINNLRQQLISLTHSHRKDCDDIRMKLENWRCPECRNQQENCAAASSIQRQYDLPLQYIGTIQTHFPEKRGTPRQPGICSNLIAKLTLSNEIFTNPEHALEGLQEYSHMWILFHFHKNDSTHIRAKVSPPRLNGLRTGVFATRSPHRPCPIGLSLVKIDRIMDNSIYFSGVDMIDQTPVLDIKPYIPLYDNPSIAISNTDYESNSNSSNTDTSETRHRRTSLNRSSFSDNNVNETNDLGDNLDNMNVRMMDGEENGGRNQNVVGGGSNMRLSLNSNLEESYYLRSTSRIGEREAPDGEEEESPRQPRSDTQFFTNTTTPEGNIRVPSWIDQPPVSNLTVLFKERALLQLIQLGNEAEEKKIAITNVLREDPRSVYLRERLGSHCYVFRIAELNVSCKFNDAAHTVTVFKIFPNSVSDSD